MANKIPESAIFINLLAIFQDVLSCARMDGCAQWLKEKIIPSQLALRWSTPLGLAPVVCLREVSAQRELAVCRAVTKSLGPGIWSHPTG